MNVDVLAPVELHDGRWLKRDDRLRFPNGVNGKLRTATWLMKRAVQRGASGVVYGGSVHAPALGRVATVAQLLGMQCTLVVGSKPGAVMKHRTVAVAVEAGAQLVHNPVAYNPALQRRAADIAASTGGAWWQMPYGISTPAGASVQMVRSFLDVDAPQVSNLPAGIRHLVVPFGSANAACGVFAGLLSGLGPASLETVHLMGVGPDRRAWFDERLRYAGFDPAAAPFTVEHHPLHPTFAVYDDRMPESLDGVVLHPTYEGKIARYLNQQAPAWWTAKDGETCLWIVGGPL